MKGIVKWLFITAGVFYILALVMAEALPPLVRSIIISNLTDAGLRVNRLTISDIGLTKTELRDIEIAGSTKPAISIASISIAYSPVGLLRGTAKEILISGATINLQELPSPSTGETHEAGAPGFTVNHLKILSSEVEMVYEGSVLAIPLNADLRRTADTQLYKINIKGLPFGDTWKCEGAIDAASGAGNFTITADTFTLQHWLEIFTGDIGLILPSAAEAAIDVTLSQWQFHHASITARAASSNIVLPPYSARANWRFNAALQASMQLQTLDTAIEFQSIIGPEFEINRPFNIYIAGESLDRLSVRTNDISIPKPLPLLIKEIDGTLSYTSGPAEFNGRYTVELPPDILASFQPSLKADRPIAATGELIFKLPPSEFPWKAQGSTGQALTVGGDSLNTSFKRLAIEYLIGGRQETIESRILLNAGGIRLTMTDLSLTGQEMRLRASLTSTDSEWRSTGHLKLEGIDAGIGDQITIRNLSAMIPFQSKQRSRHKISQAGDFNADSVDIAGLLLKKLAGRLRVGPGVTQAVGRADLPVERLEINYNGEHKIAGGIDSYSLHFEVPPATLQPQTSLAPLHPILEGIVASGTVAGAGRIEGSGSIFSGTGELRLENFDLAMEEAGVNMAGINGIIRFRDLPGLLSEPAQKVTVRELDIQGIPFRDGSVEFTVEGGGSVLVERGEFELLGGKVFFGGVRAGGEDPVIDTVLYCDRIDFDRLLNVLVGETIASGDGEINGVIPVKLTADGPLFKRGFLYSSPGIQGALQIQDASLISGGMLLVEEAVRDFNYEWVRVKLNSKNNRLDMSVIIKGVPAAKLPLEYDGKKKDFIRSRTGKRMVTLKGLTLELKFLDIDLGQLLREGGRVKIMTGKQQ